MNSSSRSAIPYPKLSEGYVAYKHIGVYGYRKRFLETFVKLEQRRIERIEQIEQLRAIEHGYEIKVVETPYDTISVDTPNDLIRVQEKMRSLSGG